LKEKKKAGKKNFLWGDPHLHKVKGGKKNFEKVKPMYQEAGLSRSEKRLIGEKIFFVSDVK